MAALAPATLCTMPDFCACHRAVETFPMSRVNEALAHLEAGNVRYHIVLKNDLT